MTQPKRTPDPEKVKKTVEQLRESNRQLEIVTLMFDELIAKVDADLRREQLNRLQGNPSPAKKT